MLDLISKQTIHSHGWWNLVRSQGWHDYMMRRHGSFV